MTRFSSETNLPSCKVTKDLVKSIEDYLIEKYSSVATRDNAENHLGNAISISITDAFGVENLDSISEFLLPRFSDQTTDVQIRLRSAYCSSCRFNATVKFSLSRGYSVVQVDYEGVNSREFVIGVIQGILNCVATTQTKNGLFHLPYWMEGVLWMLASVFISISGSIFKVFPILSYVFIILAVIIFANLFLVKRLRPYTTFDSNLSSNIDKGWSWFIGGLLSFILFSTIFSKLRDYFFK